MTPFATPMQGAGGVGGLLMVQDGGQTYLPMYDALGNVHGMIKAVDGTIAAAYEYDAFGNTLRESGPYAASNPFRYSTKYTDIESGLVYYGHRFYSPSLGRFINKDPIEEQGGLNLYAFCGNNGVNRWDYLGNIFISPESTPAAAARRYLADPENMEYVGASFSDGIVNTGIYSGIGVRGIAQQALDNMALSGGSSKTPSVRIVPNEAYDPLPSNLAPNSGVANGAVGVGGVLVEAGLVRDGYNALVSQLQATGQFDPARDAIRAQMNSPGNSTAVSRSMGDLYRWEQAAAGVTKSNANPAATSAAMNSAGAIAKYGGGALVVVGVGASVVTVTTASDPYRAGAQQSAGIIVGYGGASGGAAVGAAIGTAIFPGLGTGIGALAGAVIGGVGGGFAGQRMGGGAYDAIYGPPPKR